VLAVKYVIIMAPQKVVYCVTAGLQNAPYTGCRFVLLLDYHLLCRQKTV